MVLVCVSAAQMVWQKKEKNIMKYFIIIFQGPILRKNIRKIKNKMILLK